MASPPPGYHGPTSPPGISSLALPRQRPSLALPTGVKSRKPSSTNTPSSAHPLRQTSFPPSDRLGNQHASADDSLARYSPSAEGSLDDFSDSEIKSAISGPVADEGGTRKRKRGEKRARGRPPKHATFRASSASLVNGEEGKPVGAGRRAGTAGAASVITGDDADAEEDDDEEGELGAGGGRLPVYEGGQMTQAELSQQRERSRLFYEAASEDHKDRLRSYGQAKLRTADVRRLVNQTLSQSVPQSVVLVVSSYTKMFAGVLIEEARKVQREWEAVEEKRADGKENKAWKRLKTAHGDGDPSQAVSGINGTHDEQSTGSVTVAEEETRIKDEPQTPVDGVMSGDSEATTPLKTPEHAKSLRAGGAGGLSGDVSELDRGPLLPDHLREALRRYKKRRGGGSVGFTGLSLEGKENTASRLGGRRLFR